MTAPGTIAGFSIFVVMEATQKDFADPSAAIKQWAGQFEQEMLGWAYKKTNDHNQAADIVQETFIAAFQAYDSFKGQSKPKTWLFSILKNKITDFYRKKYRKEVVKSRKRAMVLWVGYSIQTRIGRRIGNPITGMNHRRSCWITNNSERHSIFA